MSFHNYDKCDHNALICMGLHAHDRSVLLGAQAVEVLLRAGADLNRTDDGETSPLFFAAAGGHVEVPFPGLMSHKSTLAGSKPKDEDEGPEFESWRMRLVFQLNTDISRSDWRLCPIGQHLVNLIVDKQFDTRLWCLIVNSTAIRP